jgi:hypothetical protein
MLAVPLFGMVVTCRPLPAVTNSWKSAAEGRAEAGATKTMAPHKIAAGPLTRRIARCSHVAAF